MWGDGWGSAAYGWFALMHLLWWAIVIIGIVGLVRWSLGGRRNRPGAAAENAALDILRERYARGEIGREEYEERKRVLQG